ncbi:MAG: asparagine synthase (glutamine-hydrolyzing) [Cyanobacteria bacterium P01_D01_bin.56]
MCGITGYWSQPANSEKMTAIAERMTSTLRQRGPDDSGTWVDETTGLSLGHRRLAILDLSPEGHQPMMSDNGRYVLVFNGEIYNFSDLRQQLLNLGHGFRGYSDTEVMLAGFCQWGVKMALERFVGMFAFALWDRQNRCLHLGRDRLGEKPLYYGWLGQTLLFGSELKALKAYPKWQGQIDRGALALFVRYGYVPAPYSIYQGIYKLPPATLITFAQPGPSPQPQPQPYWSVVKTFQQGQASPFQGNTQDAINQLEHLLSDAIGQQMLADVPLGAFLSGGIDSSTIVALMQTQSSYPVKTFTIGFHEDAYNEAEYAKAVAQHLGTNHTELYVNPEEALAVIPNLPSLYSEPFADASQIPTFLVSQLARQQVTVSLSGDGGDELFGGYNRYLWAESAWRSLGWIPSGAKQILFQAMTRLSPETWNALFQKKLNSFLPWKLQQQLPGDKLHKLARVLAFDSREDLYQKICSLWLGTSDLVYDAPEYVTNLTSRNSWWDEFSYTEWMMVMDILTYLPEDILTKVDRAAMGVSLESRIPFLDHRVVEFASALPLDLKIRQGQSKWLLRQVLYKHVPKQLIERPKVGFGVPLDTWLRHELRDWAEDLLSERRLREDGWFQIQPIRQKWQEHLLGHRNWQYYIWNVLMFQAWLEQA